MGFSKRTTTDTGKSQRVTVEPSSVADPMQKASRNGVYFLQGAIIVAAFLLVLVVCGLIAGRVNLWGLIAAVVVAVVVASSVHIAQQWERMVILRLGKFKCVKGPGLFFTVPFIEYSTMRIDMRIRTTAFGAEETLSTDLVPLDVDAVVFWMVHDAEKACVAVDDYAQQLLLSAQTMLRDAIGRATAAEVTARRNQLDRELKRLLEEKVSEWGLTVLSVEVRNILLPVELQEVMSLEAQAEQQKKARLILTEAEADIASMIEGYFATYTDERALDLRKMYLLYEAMKEGKSSLVVPSSWSDGFSDNAVEQALKSQG